MNFDLADPGILLAYLQRLLNDKARQVAPEIDPRVYEHRGLCGHLRSRRP